MASETRLARAEAVGTPTRSLVVGDVSMRVLEAAISALALIAAILLGLAR